MTKEDRKYTSKYRKFSIMRCYHDFQYLRSKQSSYLWHSYNDAPVVIPSGLLQVSVYRSNLQGR